MHLQLDSRPGIADVSADGLALRFSATPGLDVVATTTSVLSGSGLVVVVEVLAASHRVHLLDGDGVLATEQVACVGRQVAEPLPAHAVHDLRGRRLHFVAERPELDSHALAGLASGLRAGADDHRALVVTFPGHPDAVTSVRVLDDGWESWHLYPGERPHAVRTRTRVGGR